MLTKINGLLYFVKIISGLLSFSLISALKCQSLTFTLKGREEDKAQ